MTDEFVCNCNRRHATLPGTPHDPWCNFLKPRPDVVRDPARLRSAVAALTGGNEDGTEAIGGGVHDLHGIPAVIGTDEDFPLTSRPGEYLGQPRDVGPALAAGLMAAMLPGSPAAIAAVVAASTVKRLVCVDVLARGEQRGPDSVPGGEPDALRSAYGALLDAAMDLRRFLQQRDGQ